MNEGKYVLRLKTVVDLLLARYVWRLSKKMHLFLIKRLALLTSWPAMNVHSNRAYP